MSSGSSDIQDESMKDTGVASEGGAETIVERTLRSQKSIIRDVVRRVAKLTDRDLPREKPSRIILFGVGSSHHAARVIAAAVSRDASRPRIPILACSSMAVGTEIIPQREDWGIAITHRGGSASTLEALARFEKMGAYTIGVTGKGVSLGNERTAPDLQLETTEIETVEPHTVSVSAAIAAVTTLLLGPKVVEEWEIVCSLPDPGLERLRQMAGNGPDVVLGEWEGEWLAREAALKLLEMARVPVRAYGTEEYFHGPRQALGARDKRWHIATHRDERGMEIDADHRIMIMGNSPLSWFPALVELQWLALAVALNRGEDPDRL